jgi:hypothetical protein
VLPLAVGIRDGAGGGGVGALTRGAFVGPGHVVLARPQRAGSTDRGLARRQHAPRGGRRRGRRAWAAEAEALAPDAAALLPRGGGKRECQVVPLPVSPLPVFKSQSNLGLGFNESGQHLCFEFNKSLRINNKTEPAPTCGGWQGPLIYSAPVS